MSDSTKKMKLNIGLVGVGVIGIILLVLGLILRKPMFEGLSLTFLIIGSILISAITITGCLWILGTVISKLGDIFSPTNKSNNDLDETEELLLCIEKIRNRKKHGPIETTYYKYYLTSIYEIPDKAICMISKTEIDSTDDILQCNFCQNYFITKYIVHWITENYNCPVCNTDLKEFVVGGIKKNQQVRWDFT